jgi:hypothetical protein
LSPLSPLPNIYISSRWGNGGAGATNGLAPGFMPNAPPTRVTKARVLHSPRVQD